MGVCEREGRKGGKRERDFREQGMDIGGGRERHRGFEEKKSNVLGM